MSPPAAPAAIANTRGTARPRIPAPAGATDCHIHVYDPRFAPPVERPQQATAGDYRLLQARLGTTRVVVVQPRPYGTDNSAVLDAIAQFGLARARGVAVVFPDISDAELRRLHAGGIRGLRFTVGKPDVAVVAIAMIEPLAQRIAALGWHVQLHMTGAQIVEHEALLWRVAAPLVFDHMGRPPLPAGSAHRSHAILLELLAARRAWVKLSGATLNRLPGAPADHDHANALARSFVRAAPERLLWGSDWPHPSAAELPDDAELFDLLAEQAPAADTRRRILVDNPAALYGFAD